MPKRTCSVPGCIKPYRSNGYCKMHLARVASNGDPGPVGPVKQQAKGRECEVEGCGRPVRCKALCSIHYGRLRTRGYLGGPDVEWRAYRPGESCSVAGCEKRPEARGMCLKHYNFARDAETDGTCGAGACIYSAVINGYCRRHNRRLALTGDVQANVPLRKLPARDERDDIESRIMARARRTARGCIEWTGPVNRSGYGSISWRRQHWMVHRAIWTVQVAPIPEGDWSIDHLCYNPRCINVKHLELVTRAENTLRMMLRKYGHVDELPPAVLKFLRDARDAESAPPLPFLAS